MLGFLDVSAVSSLLYAIALLIELLNHGSQGLDELLVLHVDILCFSANKMDNFHEGVLDA